MTYWDKPEYEHFRYNVKYIMKNEKDPLRQGHFVMSKKPPIGAKYFFDLALKTAKAGLAPQTLEYSWPDVVKKNGERRKFRLTGSIADYYLGAWCNAWLAIHGPKRHIPPSEVVEKYLDKICNYTPELVLEPYRAAAHPKDKVLDISGIYMQRGAIEARKRGFSVIEETTKWGDKIYSLDDNLLVWEETEHTYYYAANDGRWWSWRKAENGEGWTWRDVKAEIAHKKFLEAYKAAALRARQEGRPSRIIIGQRPRVTRGPAPKL